MWIVREKNTAFNLEMYASMYVYGHMLIFESPTGKDDIELDYESNELALKDFQHIITAMKRKEQVMYL